MYLNELITKLETFAPLETQEKWDNSGWQIKLSQNPLQEVTKVLLCVSVTNNTINQAKENKCDIVISHHPLFFVPLEFNQGINIYSAHTNLDKASGGTTDTLIETLNLDFDSVENYEEFVRIINLKSPISIKKFVEIAKSNLDLEHLRIVNNHKKQEIEKIAFCAGSGADFINDAETIGADLFVTGDIKYHTALDSNVIIADVGHFESERPVLLKLKELLERDIEVIIADEKSPFTFY